MDAKTDSRSAAPLAEGADVTVAPLSPVARFSLRAKEEARRALAEALGAELPDRVGRCVEAGDVRILSLGPDEWLIQAPDAESTRIAKACDDVYANAPHALTDISDREVSFGITGPKAAELLTLGCPRDLDALPVGEARRTVFDGATVVLWRDADTAFRLDAWLSFAPHVAALLVTGAAELAAE
jgi:sarcosine oxidase subunit gamma